MNKIFENQVVLISGGLGDIGLAIATAFAAQGAAISLCDLKDNEEAEGFLSGLRTFGVPLHYQKVNIAQYAEVAGWVQAAEAALGTATIVIANAATVTVKAATELTASQWTDDIDINLNGSFYVTQTAANRMIENRIAGRIVFIGSWAAHAVHPNLPAYSVSKAAVRMLCKCLALELAPHQILVNEIAPGYVQAGLSAAIWKSNPDLSEQARNRVPVRKLITAHEVAGQVLQICHPNNIHITGSTILMDGGLSLLT